MTKQDYLNKQLKVLEYMIGEDVIHNDFGLGKIIGFENSKCIVKYERFKTNKMMSSATFFEFNEPVAQSTIEELNQIKCEYEISQKMKNQKPIPNTIKDIEVEKKEITSDKKIKFEDVIGLDEIKELVNQMVIYPFKYRDIYKAFKRDSGGGILLYGAPGTGKTMIAKAIANEVDAKFISIKCSDIVSKWYGESEKKIKEFFTEARKYRRSIIFFDEFDSLGVSREKDNSHAVNMVVSELLAQIDGFETIENTILLIASTNKPWNIDSALLRSGRFNKKIYVGLPNHKSRCDLLIYQFKGVPIDEIDYEAIADKTDGYSNADIVELCNETKDIAIKRSIANNEISNITQEDIMQALSQVSSTIVKNELDKLVSFSLKS